MSTKVDSLIGRMDCFMNCFADLHATVTKNQRSNDKKIKHLEAAHNKFAVKISDSTTANRNRIEALETQLKDSLSANSALIDRIGKLEEKQNEILKDQGVINEHHTKEIKNLKIEQGYTNRNLYDCFAEVKEGKMIISGVNESVGEDTAAVALGCINKIISAAIAQRQANDRPGGLKKLNQNSIDNVF